MLASSGRGVDSEIRSSDRMRLCVRDSSLVEEGEVASERVVGVDTRGGRS